MRLTTAFSTAILSLAAATAPATPLAAQAPQPDSLLASGQLDSAESLYFAHAAARPRDPGVRAALGRYLGARGAARVGAVLLEEARFFGGDPKAVATDLVPLYRSLGDYRALVTLPASPLTIGERLQAAWLASHAPTLEMPESTWVSYRATPGAATLGTVTLRIGGKSVVATIDPRRQGIVLDASARNDTAVRVFRTDSTATVVGVASRVRLGELSLGNVPVSLEWLGERKAVIGLDLLRAYAPTFDAARGRILLRRLGRVSRDMPGQRLPVLLLPDDVQVLARGRFVPLAGGDGSPLARARRWTLDARRGEIVIGG